MFFWVGLAVVFIIFVSAFLWGVAGLGGRFHEPGTKHLDTPKEQRRSRRGA